MLPFNFHQNPEKPFKFVVKNDQYQQGWSMRLIAFSGSHFPTSRAKSCLFVFWNEKNSYECVGVLILFLSMINCILLPVTIRFIDQLILTHYHCFSVFPFSVQFHYMLEKIYILFFYYKLNQNRQYACWYIIQSVYARLVNWILY